MPETHLQMWFEGASFIADSCEAANNDDDLSDIFTYMGYTCANAAGVRTPALQCSPALYQAS